MTTTITVRGHKIRSASQRRYIVVIVSADGAHIWKRSDSITTAHAHQRRYGFPTGARAIVIDTTTGQEA